MAVKQIKQDFRRKIIKTYLSMGLTSMKVLIWNRLLINNNIKMVPPTLDPSEKIKGMENVFKCEGYEQDGYWRNNKCHGQVKMTDSLLERLGLQRKLYNNEKDLYGEFFDITNGYIYKGWWQGDKKHRYGVQKSSNGMTFYGTFVQNQKNYYGYSYDPNGRLVLQGLWLNGESIQ